MIDLHKSLDEIMQDEDRSKMSLHLTANETIMSNTAKYFMKADIANRYYFGGGGEEGVVDFGPSTFRGLIGVSNVVDVALDSVKRMLGASHVSLGCLSGVHAMMCAILSATEPGDTIMSLDIAHGGHFSTKSVIERTGRRWFPTSYNFERQELDLQAIARSFAENKIRVLYLDTSFYISPHNLREVRETLGEEVIIIYDASHTLGLIMGGRFQDPFSEGVDIICANTHKTLPGPQKGLIAIKNNQIGEKVMNIIDGGLYSSPHTSSMIALAITILEMDEFGAGYAEDIIRNSNLLAEYLAEKGYEVKRANTGRYSENHQIHLLTDNIGEYRSLYKAFDTNNISVNFSNTLGGGMFIRLGTQEVTRRGMKQAEMEKIADFIDRSLRGQTGLDANIKEFVSQYDTVHYSFDARV